MSPAGTAIPRRRSSFLGRDDDIAAVTARVDSAPAVTLVGVGGVGKTSLAYAAAKQIESRGDTTVHVVEFASTRESDAVARVLADRLGLPATSDQPPEEALAGRLNGEGRTLLVLDNCEQIVEGVALLVDRLIEECPELYVLATSRVPLGIEGEHVWPVEPLAVEGADHEEGPAIQLLIERAEAAHPRSLTDLDHDRLAELARRLDGVPLALELAAARLGTMSIDELASQLDRELLELESSRRGTADRHRSLDAVVEWSYNLLSPEDQVIATKLSVFRGTFTRDAAVEVVGEGAADAIDRFVNSSLLLVSERAGAVRFQMLEMIREFLGGRLEESGEERAVRRAHAEWAAATARDLAQALRSPDEKAAAARFAAEEANIRAALSCALENGATDLATTLVVGLHEHVLSRGGREVHAWIEQAIHALWNEPEAGDVFIVGATAAMVRGEIARNRELLEHADEIGAEGLHLLVNRDVDWLSVLTFEGDLEQALERVDATFDTLPDDPWARTYMTIRRAMPYAYGGRPEEAVVLADEAVTTAEHLQNPTLLGWAHFVRGESVNSDDPQEAIRRYRQAVAYAEEVDNTFLQGLLSLALAAALGREGDPIEALGQFRATIARWNDAGAWSFLSTALRHFGAFLDRIGRFEDAVTVSCAVRHQEGSSEAGGPEAARDRRLRDHFIAELGEQEFDRLEGEAQHLKPDDLVDLALDIIDDDLCTRTNASESGAIVFTDIEGSTRFMAGEHSDRAARRELRPYDELTDAALGRHRGERIKGTGDGVLATFPTVDDALAAVVELLREVEAGVHSGKLPLRVRVGVNYGTMMRDMADLHGTSVNLAARVVDQAAGGEIVVTDSVRELADKDDGAEYRFTELGQRELKGIPEPVGLHRLDW